MRILRDDKEYRVLIICLAISLFALCFVSLSVGVYNVPFSETIKIFFSGITGVEQSWTDTMYAVVMNIRLPRVIAAVLIGFALAIAGVCYQGIFQNPLVSPDILGVSAGASVGASIAILMGLNYYCNLVFAFLGGLIAVALCMSIPAIGNKKTALALVLSGIIIGSFLNAILGLIKYLANPESQLAEITFWQLGSLSKVNYISLAIVTPLITICCVFLFLMRWRINALSFSDREAQSLGINLVKERGLVILFSTVLTATSVCISGTIGWIGLIIPHFARLMVGSNSAKVLPLAGMMGAVFLLIVDLLSRNLTGAEIPLGIITGILGAPSFAVLLIKRSRG